MIFVFLKVGLEHTGDEIKKVLDLRITKTGQDGFHKGIIGKFLQVNHQGFFIGLPIQAETDQAIIVIDKFMGVAGFVHGFGYMLFRPFLEEEFDFKESWYRATARWCSFKVLEKQWLPSFLETKYR